MDETFNLMVQPWIKVYETKTNQQKEVSIKELFEHADQFLQLSGESKAQDLAILRLLLAILTRVYAEDDANVDLWQELYEQGHFDDKLFDYLTEVKQCFDLLGDKPFFQVNKEIYNQNVEAKKHAGTGKGTVSIKQLDRTISESNNTPAIFSPKSDTFKNSLKLSELARWIVAYQNYTGVTDKTKILTKEKFSVSSGWTYGLNPFFAKGKNLFETLMLNLVLDGKDKKQKPVWEFEIQEYLEKRKKAITPDNLSELYTLWSRMLHIEWDGSIPVIYTAGLPKVEPENEFHLEPMTTWKENKDGDFKPAVKSKNNLNVAMWRNFGEYIVINSDKGKKRRIEPRLIKWLKKLSLAKVFDLKTELNLVNVSLVSDGNATSQSPYAEICDDMRTKMGVAFDQNPELTERWPIKIENMVELSQIIGKDYWIFANKVSVLIGLNDKAFANKKTAEFYDALNEPFVIWLESIKPGEKRLQKLKEWRTSLNSIAFNEAKKLISNLPDSAFLGRTTDDNSKNRNNIFTIYRQFRYNVSSHLGLVKKKKKVKMNEKNSSSHE